jgi:hypothetical protein
MYLYPNLLVVYVNGKMGWEEDLNPNGSNIMDYLDVSEINVRWKPLHHEF